MKPRAADLLKVVLLAGIYVATARLGLLMDAVSGFATLVWPPAGVSLVALLVFGYRLWPGIALGAFIVNAWVGAPLAVACAIAAGNTLEALIGAYLLRRVVGFHNTLDCVRDVMGLIGLAALFGPTVSATIGVSSLVAGGVLPLERFVETWSAWWWGDVAGDLFVAPLLLTWSERPRVSLGGRAQRRVEVVALGLSVLLVGTFVFYGWSRSWARQLQVPWLLFPLLIWAGLRFGPRGAATTNFIVAVLAISAPAIGLGPFVRPTLHESLTNLQAFMAILGGTTLTLGAVVSERAQAHSLARETEARKSAIFAAARDGIVTIDHKGEIREFNSAAEELFGFLRREVIGKEMASLIIPPALREAHRRGMAHYLATGEGPILGKRACFSALRADGTQFPVEVTITRVPIDGPPTFTGFIRDITAQKQSEEALRKSQEELEQKVEERTAELRRANLDLRAALQEKDVLFKEVHHRVKNNLQVISSLLNLQASAVPSAEARVALQESESRIHSIALVHQLLYRSRDLANIDCANYLENLVERLRSAYGARPEVIDVSVRAPKLRLDVDTAVPCGMIVNELVSNSLKHAFPGGRHGHITVALDHDEAGSCVLMVSDDGVGIPKGLDLDKVQTLGLQIVCMLAKQLHGAVELGGGERGTMFRVTFSFVPIKIAAAAATT